MSLKLGKTFPLTKQRYDISVNNVIRRQENVTFSGFIFSLMHIMRIASRFEMTTK